MYIIYIISNIMYGENCHQNKIIYYSYLCTSLIKCIIYITIYHYYYIYYIIIIYIIIIIINIIINNRLYIILI